MHNVLHYVANSDATEAYCGRTLRSEGHGTSLISHVGCADCLRRARATERKQVTEPLHTPCTEPEEIPEDAPTTHVLRDYEIWTGGRWSAGVWQADEARVGVHTLTAEDSRALLEQGLVYACRHCSGYVLSVYHLLPDVDYDTVQNIVGSSPEEKAERATYGDISTEGLHAATYAITGTVACDICRPKLDAQKLARLRDGRTTRVHVTRPGSPLQGRIGRVVAASTDGVVATFPGRGGGKVVLSLSDFTEAPDAPRRAAERQRSDPSRRVPSDAQ